MDSEPFTNALADGSSEEGEGDAPDVGGRCNESYIAVGPEGDFQELSEEEEEEEEVYQALSNVSAGVEEPSALEIVASEAAGSCCNGSSGIDGLGVDQSLLGERVVLQGLQAKPELNGCTGVALSYDTSQGRYAVKLDVFGAQPAPEADQGTVKLLKASNLVLHEDSSASNDSEDWGAFKVAAANEPSHVMERSEAQARGLQTEEEVSAKLLKRMNADWERTVAAADAATAAGNVNGAPRRLNVQYNMRQASSTNEAPEQAPAAESKVASNGRDNATSGADSAASAVSASGRAGLLHKVAGRRWEDNPLDSDTKDAIRAAMAKVTLKAPPPANIALAAAVTGNEITASGWATDFDFSRADAPDALRELGLFQRPQLPQPKSRLKKKEPPIPAFANFDNDTPSVLPPASTETSPRLGAEEVSDLGRSPAEASVTDSAQTKNGATRSEANTTSTIVPTLVAAARLRGMSTLVHLDLRPVGAPASGDVATRAVLLGACAQVRNLRGVGLSSHRGAFGAAARDEAATTKGTGSVLFLEPSQAAGSQAAGGVLLPAVVPGAWAYNVRLLAVRLSTSETCQSAQCFFVDFGETSFASNTTPTAAEMVDMKSALAELGAAVVKLCALRGGVTVVVRGWPFPSNPSKAAQGEKKPPTSEWDMPPAVEYQSGDDKKGECLWVHSPCRPRDNNTSADLLAAEEDACFDADFLASDSDVNDYPIGWICPFLPSPASRTTRFLAMLPVRPTDHVLDIGCGDGRLLVAAASQVPGVVCSGIDIDSGLIAKANAAAVAASVDSRCSFATRDALALVPKSDSSNAGVEPTLSDNAKSSSSDHHDKDEAEKATQQWAVVQAADTHIWPNAETRPISVVVLFLVVPALRAVRPLVRALWERGGVSVVTTGGYHFEDWPYDRADFDFDVRVIDAKRG